MSSAISYVGKPTLPGWMRLISGWNNIIQDLPLGQSGHR